MIRLITAVTAYAFVIGTVAAHQSAENYEQHNFTGHDFCVGKPDKSCTKANPITAPDIIGSIKFGKGCDLVVNVKVLDEPYDRHVEVFSTDVANTGYNTSFSYSDHWVDEVYVEEAGRVCLLGATTGVPEEGGLCYTKDVPVVDFKFRDAITELMLFKSDAKDFDVIAYENENYNSLLQTPIASEVSEGDTKDMSHRFTSYSNELETGEIDRVTGMKKYMAYKVRSIKIVAPLGDSTPGSVAPGSYSP